MGIAWSTGEDQLLIKTVLDFCKRGASISEAFLSAAKKLNDRTTEACSGRWYEEFSDIYKKEIDSIKKTVKRTNDFVGDWKWYDDEKLMNVMIQCLIQDMGKMEAFEFAAKEVGRSPSSCSSRWYSYIIKKNKLTIENLIEKGKQQMATVTIARTWSQQDESIAYSMMKNLIGQGVPNEEAWEKVAKRINIKKSQVRNYWYSYLYPENKKEIDFVRTQKTGNYTKQADTWPEEKKYELFKVITAGRDAGQKMLDIIAIAAATLHRPHNECHNLWYNHVSKNRDFEVRYRKEQADQKIKEAAAKVAPKFFEQPKAVMETPKVETPVVPTNNNQIDEFMELVQKLVKRNQELEQENQQLKSELNAKAAEAAQADEFKKNYNNVMNAVERARKFIVDAELGVNAKLSNK